MVLGLSWGQLALVLGASVALFGPKDIVLIGRAAGKLTGKAVGYIQTARGQFDPILQRSEINTVCDTFASYFVFVFKCIPSIWAFLLVLPLVEWSGRMRMYEPWPNRCTRSSKKQWHSWRLFVMRCGPACLF
jgi:hypothetical protein